MPFMNGHGHSPPLRFYAVWTTPLSTLTPIHRRCLLSVVHHHPESSLTVLSNSLPLGVLPGSIHIERYSLAELTAGTPAASWYAANYHKNQSRFWHNHESDLLRLLTLFHRGGIYLDVDVVLVRPVKLTPGCLGAVGLESGRGGKLAAHLAMVAGAADAEDTAASATSWPASPSSPPAILCNAVLAVARPGLAILAKAIHRFIDEYVPYTSGATMLELVARGEWGAMGPLLLTRLLLPAATASTTGAPNGGLNPLDEICILERDAFYPIEPTAAAAYFGPWEPLRDAATWARIQHRSAAVHLWNGLTKGVPLACGSLVHRLLEENSGCATASGAADCPSLPCTQPSS